MNELNRFLREDYRKWYDNDYLFEMKDGVYESVTMGEYIEKVNYLATYLIDKGYKGKNIGIYSPNSIPWMIFDVAVMNYVGLSIGLSKDWNVDNLDYSIGKCGIACLFYSKTLEDKVLEAKDKYKDLKIICIEEEFEKILEEGRELCKGMFELEPKDSDTPAKIVFTSGSTSFPKAVMLSIGNIYSSYEALGKRIKVDENDVCYLFLPLNHTYGSIFNFLYSFVFGYKVYLSGGNTANMAKEMAMVRPTVFCAVPLVFLKFHEAAVKHNIPLKMLLGGRLRYVFCGGSNLDHKIRQAYIDQGMYLMNAYALSETSSGFAIDYPEVDDMDSAGTLLEYVEAKVIDPDTDGIGELAIKGPNVFKGYYADEEATKRAFDKDGFFLTGDLGKIVGDKVYVKGRKDTMIVLMNGENVSAKRIAEKVMEASSDISSVKAYMRDGYLTCDIYVDGKDKLDRDFRQVIDKVNMGLSKFEKIRKFNVMDKSALLKG